VTDTRDILESAAIDLAHQLFTRLADIESFALTTASDLRSEILASATMHVRHLHNREAGLVNEGAGYTVCRALFGTDGEVPEEWWRTKLGQDVAWAIGHPHDLVPAAQAQAVLGVSRSYMRRIMRDGTVSSIADHVHAASLRTYIRRTAINRGARV
jgi:hypothetical protein